MIDIERTRVFGIDEPGVFAVDESSHDAEHIDLTFVNKDFGVIFVGLADAHVAEVDVIDAIALHKVAADFDRVLAHFAGDTAIEGNAVVWAGYDVN